MSKFSRYLGPIIVCLTIASVISEENKTAISYVLATALFYRNSEGVALLVTGPLSPDADQLITRELHGRLPPPLQVKVIPIYNNLYEVPVHRNLWKHLKYLYPTNLFILNLSTVDSRRVMQNIEKRVFMYNETVSNKIERRKDVNNETTMRTTTRRVQSFRPTSPDDFIPNDIYYAVEKRCANWAVGCEVNAGSILDMPSKYFFVPRMEYKIPHKLRWIPR